MERNNVEIVLLEKKHIPIQVIDYILEQLVREKQGRTDFLEDRKKYFYYLVQSYFIFKHSMSLLDGYFELRRQTINFISFEYLNDIDERMYMPYKKLFDGILVVYETFWHYDIDMQKNAVRSHFSERVLLVSSLYNEFNDFNIPIHTRDIVKDYFNISTEWGWDYEIERHGGSGKRPTTEENWEIIKQKWKVIEQRKKK